MKNYRRQFSPVVAQFFEISQENEDTLKIGEEKYQG